MNVMEAELPEGFRQEMEALLGADESEKLLKALNTAPAVGVRLNTRKRPETPLYEGMTAVPWCKDGYWLAERPQFTLNPLLHAGCFYVQDPSSMVYQAVVEKIMTEGGFSSPAVLDMCAAPGGKSTAMLNALPGSAVLVSNEYVGKRAAILKENLTKWGFPNSIVTNSDSADFAKSGAVFDIVAVDAPCSGEGMMRKEEVARTQWSPGLVRDCARLQREILDNAIRALKPGGYLIYSTCTFNAEENEQNTAYIAGQEGMEHIPLEINGVPEECSRISRSVAEKTGGLPGLRFMPHITDGEGLFIALFRKRGASEPRTAVRGTYKQARKQRAEKGNSAETLYFQTDAVKEMLGALQPHARVLQAGVPMAERKGKLELPLSERVLTTSREVERYPNIETDLKTALAYLRREAIVLPAGTPTGYVEIRYQGFPLGLVKNLGNRANNLYPAQWRIRKQ